jgi:MYXO-CTERM domain-containing protein
VGVSYDYTPTVTGAGSTPRFFIGAGDTCGGTVDPATGAYQFTPQTSGPCVVAVQACDASQTSACNTQSTTVEVARADGFADGVGLSGGGCGCQSVTDAGSVWGFVVAALGGLRLRRRRG